MTEGDGEDRAANMGSPQIVFVRDTTYGDWEGIYVDGALKYEGHYVEAEQVLEALGLSYDVRYTALKDGGRLPAQLHSVQKQGR